ncbi:hypothetical protein HCN44_000046 [Aphidius gifuensis]|uniref:Ion transport domain-containing protein n=1 Tax=Aphidius gifuensis TaxID=684658 RepID=A0A834XSZ6_APHGI|nr:hypothetical protein HCN44_000046 [Aphidius gifuensis]
MSPILAVELLFFAIFGQTTHEQFKVDNSDGQPVWTTALFKLAFGIYMLVSVVVLINLLIAMMSDTYQRIQQQSDLEWKSTYSKLIRNMHRTTTAPAPLNLLTTWISYFYRQYEKRSNSKQRPSLVQLMGLRRTGRLSPRSKMGAKWLSRVKKTQIGHKDSVALSVAHLSPLGSQLSFSNSLRIDNVVDWEVVRRKYLLASPIDVTEKLFFAIFGQKDADDFTIALGRGQQPPWTIYVFKISFSMYMLVSVIVLINLLIAMMSDTYQSIQQQSDIEWKYGLSKLIRNMQKASSAPSPLNLLTTWMSYFYKICKKRYGKKQKMNVMEGFVKKQAMGKRAFAIGEKSVSFKRLPEGSAGSQLFLPNIANILDWEVVRKKYRLRFGGLTKKN